MPKRSGREPGVATQPLPATPEIRASAARIIDIVQQLVIARPEMVIPLEEIVRGAMVDLRIDVDKRR
ncbi:MAG: hypothetical protein ABI868_20440 [Acidobacteriota bacterium]